MNLEAHLTRPSRVPDTLQATDCKRTADRSLVTLQPHGEKAKRHSWRRCTGGYRRRDGRAYGPALRRGTEVPALSDTDESGSHRLAQWWAGETAGDRRQDRLDVAEKLNRVDTTLPEEERRSHQVTKRLQIDCDDQQMCKSQ